MFVVPISPFQWKLLLDILYFDRGGFTEEQENEADLPGARDTFLIHPTIQQSNNPIQQSDYVHIDTSVALLYCTR